MKPENLLQETVPLTTNPDMNTIRRLGEDHAFIKLQRLNAEWGYRRTGIYQKQPFVTALKVLLLRGIHQQMQGEFQEFDRTALIPFILAEYAQFPTAGTDQLN